MVDLKGIEIKNVTKDFGSNRALDNVSLVFEGPGPFGIVGPDGAGKTTLTRILAGVMTFRGEVNVLGAKYPKQNNQAKKHIGYMPQTFGLYQDLSVYENLVFYAELFGMTMSQIKERIPRLLKFANLEPFISRPAGKLSGGMKQKLALCACLIHDPTLLILDEPGAGVDPISRREFWRIIDDLVKQGIMVVVSTTYMDEAEKCSRIVYLRNGKIYVDGTVDEIKKGYKLQIFTFRSDNLRMLRASLKDSSLFQYVNFFGDSIHAAGKIQKADVSNMVDQKLISRFPDLMWDESDPGLEDVFVHLGGESS